MLMALRSHGDDYASAAKVNTVGSWDRWGGDVGCRQAVGTSRVVLPRSVLLAI